MGGRCCGLSPATLAYWPAASKAICALLLGKPGGAATHGFQAHHQQHFATGTKVFLPCRNGRSRSEEQCSGIRADQEVIGRRRPGVCTRCEWRDKESINQQILSSLAQAHDPSGVTTSCWGRFGKRCPRHLSWLGQALLWLCWPLQALHRSGP